MHNVMNGLFWFCFPVLLVVINDIMAYVCGMSMGRKFINRPFLKLSPNKTWEGFIGGGICTIILGFYLAKLLSKFTWMTCPVDTLSIWSPKLTCEAGEAGAAKFSLSLMVPCPPHSNTPAHSDSLFEEGNFLLPEQVFDIVPNQIIRSVPNIVEYCEYRGVVSPCVSGTEWTHHHFEMKTKVLPIQVRWLSQPSFAKAAMSRNKTSFVS